MENNKHLTNWVPGTGATERKTIKKKEKGGWKTNSQVSDIRRQISGFRDYIMHGVSKRRGAGLKRLQLMTFWQNQTSNVDAIFNIQGRSTLTNLSATSNLSGELTFHSCLAGERFSVMFLCLYYFLFHDAAVSWLLNYFASIESHLSARRGRMNSRRSPKVRWGWGQ